MAYAMRMHAAGTFEIQMTAEPPYDDAGGVVLARAKFDKQFSGALEATSVVHMLSARTSVDGSAGYVAIERVVGVLDGRRGSFVLMHTGVMDRGASTLSVTVVPDSGTDELRGLSGRMDIQVTKGHAYTFDYALA